MGLGNELIPVCKRRGGRHKELCKAMYPAGEDFKEHLVEQSGCIYHGIVSEYMEMNKRVGTIVWIGRAKR